MRWKSCLREMALLAIFITSLALVPDAWAGGKEKVLYAFKGGNDGTAPVGALVADASGNLYGVTLSGGINGTGTVFQLAPSGKSWKETVLHTFGSGNDGAEPYNLTLGDAGKIYGTTVAGGGAQQLCSEGCGTVFALTRDAQGKWSEKVIHRFKPEQGDGAGPYGALILDASGTLYGTTSQGGTGSCNGGCGTVFEMTSGKGKQWTEQVLYSFAGGGDGSWLYGGLLMNAKGDTMYGTTGEGGQYGNGTIFQIALSGGTWTKTTLYNFRGYPTDGETPGDSSLIFDNVGNLYGTTAYGGTHACGCCGCGTVFELHSSNGHWSERILHDFSGEKDDRYPFGPILGGNGHLYGTTSGQINGQTGTVFELIPASEKKHEWQEQVVYGFRRGNDGYAPSGGVVRRAGDLYGVASFGGDLSCGEGYGCGVIFEITP